MHIHLSRNQIVRAIVLAASLAVGFDGGAQELKPGPSVQSSQIAEKDPAAWKDFKSEKGRFIILFPGAPREDTQSIPGPGITFELRTISLHTFAEYSAMYADYPESVSDQDSAVARSVLDNGLEGAVAEVHSELVSVEQVFIDGHPGRSYTERMPNGSILRGKTFLVGHRLYQIAITTPSEQAVAVETVRFYEATARKFLDSFRLINAPTVDKSP